MQRFAIDDGGDAGVAVCAGGGAVVASSCSDFGGRDKKVVQVTTGTEKCRIKNRSQ